MMLTSACGLLSIINPPLLSHPLLLLLLRLQVIPILRAGLVLLEQAATLLPASETYHLGYVRNDETLQVQNSSSSSSSSTAAVLV
jgi:hypothetical protein